MSIVERCLLLIDFIARYRSLLIRSIIDYHLLLIKILIKTIVIVSSKLAN